MPNKIEVTVIHNTLAAGGVNANDAVVTVVSKQGTLTNVPVAVQDEYLTTTKFNKFRLWPLGRSASK